MQNDINKSNRSRRQTCSAFSTVITLTLVGACAASPDRIPRLSAAEVSRHALFVDRRGHAIDLRTWDGGAFDPDTWYGAERDPRTEAALVKAIVQGAESALANCDEAVSRLPAQTSGEISEGRYKEILIFFHGGLNSNADSLARTRKLIPDIKTPCRYPIFVNWRSGGFSSYKDHLIRIRQGEPKGWIAKLSSPLYLVTDMAQAVVGAPKAWLTQGAHAVTSATEPPDAELSGLSVCGPGITQPCLATFEPLCETGSNRRQLRKAIWLATSPSKLVVTPVVYEMGKPAWDVMLHRSNTMIWTTCDLDPSCPKDPDTRSAADLMGSGALARLLREVHDLTVTEGGAANYQITLVGHSMGAIIINRLVTLLPELPVRNIIFLGSADSIRNTQSGVLHFLEHAENAKFYSWMLHPDNEERELSARGLLPSGSLLTWIDNMYTSPETLLDKRFGRWQSLKRIPKIIPEEFAGRVRLMVFPLNDRNRPFEHGDFGGCDFWDLDAVERMYDGR